MYKFWVKRIEVKGSLHGSALESRSGIIRLKDEGETNTMYSEFDDPFAC